MLFAINIGKTFSFQTSVRRIGFIVNQLLKNAY